ncbi:hypothetical protein [Cellulomonas sp. ATA003]|uniref:hypothetical protein n=1 Tax=Cellulomonas sp. ATA003 TaxID=3073064 RepID=UPI002873B707|nr:hypothetical protein [Cellulomonas sp. ATA003]WNB85768.1 hypothetical protein REH70_20130 [Cellulomonas sp. ATA003]
MPHITGGIAASAAAHRTFENGTTMTQTTSTQTSRLSRRKAVLARAREVTAIARAADAVFRASRSATQLYDALRDAGVL